MAFTKQDELQIASLLGVAPDRYPEIASLLTQIELVSEMQVQLIKRIAFQLQEARDEQHRINVEEAGLIQADVVKFSEGRNCQLNTHVHRLRYELATAIGFKMPPMAIF